MVRSGRVFAIVTNEPVINQMADLNTTAEANMPPPPAVPTLYQRRRASRNEGNARNDELHLDGFEFGSLNAFQSDRNSRNAPEDLMSDQGFGDLMSSALSGGQVSSAHDGNAQVIFTDKQIEQLMQGDLFTNQQGANSGPQLPADAFGDGNNRGNEDGGDGGPLGDYDRAPFFPG